MKYGTPAQQNEYLPRILDRRDLWCQGYSEPGAGSDLASLKTRADRDGETYVVNGQKTWTAFGQYANRISVLCGRDPTADRRRAFSFLLIDLDTPGIEMCPIRLIEGGYEVNDVFFTHVRVPAGNLVVAENEGWTIDSEDQIHRDSTDDQRSRPPRPRATGGSVPVRGSDGKPCFPPDGHAMHAASYFNNRNISIYGGFNEIQRNILAMEILA